MTEFFTFVGKMFVLDCIFLFNALLGALAYALYLKTVGKNEKTVKSDSVHSVERVNGVLVIFDCSESLKETAKKALQRLPQELLYSFQIRQFVIRVLNHENFVKYTTEKTNFSNPENVSGYFDCLLMEIVCDAEASNLLSTIRHEFGHYCDYVHGECKGFYSENDDFVSRILAKAKQNPCSKIGWYYLQNTTEFVAYCVDSFLGNSCECPSEIRQIAYEYLMAAQTDGEQISIAVNAANLKL